jgi:hypothetical protein
MLQKVDPDTLCYWLRKTIGLVAASWPTHDAKIRGSAKQHLTVAAANSAGAAAARARDVRSAKHLVPLLQSESPRDQLTHELQSSLTDKPTRLTLIILAELVKVAEAVAAAGVGAGAGAAGSAAATDTAIPVRVYSDTAKQILTLAVNVLDTSGKAVCQSATATTAGNSKASGWGSASSSSSSSSSSSPHLGYRFALTPATTSQGDLVAAPSWMQLLLQLQTACAASEDATRLLRLVLELLERRARGAARGGGGGDAQQPRHITLAFCQACCVSNTAGAERLYGLSSMLQTSAAWFATTLELEAACTRAIAGASKRGADADNGSGEDDTATVTASIADIQQQLRHMHACNFRLLESLQNVRSWVRSAVLNAHGA